MSQGGPSILCTYGSGRAVPGESIAVQFLRGPAGADQRQAGPIVGSQPGRLGGGPKGSPLSRGTRKHASISLAAAGRGIGGRGVGRASRRFSGGRVWAVGPSMLVSPGEGRDAQALEYGRLPAAGRRAAGVLGHSTGWRWGYGSGPRDPQSRFKLLQHTSCCAVREARVVGRGGR